MAPWTDDLVYRVQALAELADDLHNRLAQVEAGLERQRAESARLWAEHREVVAEMRAALLPLKSRIGFVEGRLDGKKETASLLISSFLSAVAVLVSALLGILNLQ
ncbi:hypothetical protein [Symbiobacterium thermophilum]|jgi:hypothetical protein|uniref:Uncharacterized protein n=2 Tax=Symbiobacterium thermophilum TaxID=2734 RepID=Q67LN2_SYMTH|nr:hypothetical protein [Symbiobacterium thermophilum]MBY6276908.1 hypothetical protein [Symbiobacterium thermophilum]BAD41414.1 hypothetical protein STH2429 [Symbiobacterium thermophilum IAM 14863]